MTETPAGGANGMGPRGVLALVLSGAVSSLGDGAFIAAAPLLAAFLTRDPLAVSIVGAASAAPWVLVGPWAGAIVDRLPRRGAMIVADSVRALGLGVLAVLVLAGAANVVALASAAFLVTAGRSFFDSASQAIVPQLVGRSSAALAVVNGRLSAVDTGGRMLIGPPLGGALFAAFPWAPFAVDAVSFAVSGALVVGIPPTNPPASEQQRLISAVRQGFSYLFHDRALVGLALTMACYNMAYNMAFGVFVLYAQDVLDIGARGFGILLAAASVGAMLMGWQSKSAVGLLGTRGAMVAGIVGQVVAWAALAATGSLVVAAIALITIGAGSTLITVAVVSERQQQVPDRLLGRVVSAFRLFGNGAAPVGAAVGGLIASSFSVTASVWAGAGCASLALLSLLGIASSPNRKVA